MKNFKSSPNFLGVIVFAIYCLGLYGTYSKDDRSLVSFVLATTFVMFYVYYFDVKQTKANCELRTRIEALESEVKNNKN
ncbi:hypothetical protein GCM10007852_04060 [Agaribacter marinus]|uniref:Uncharacterized protein n=1 Tax=Agaribacter marinus TaxID=1431249 RepID=A0AA37WH29_9ALTE|nr:hypothetical protein GCM10007852_04060 [Agaribacter marinus]